MIAICHALSIAPSSITSIAEPSTATPDFA